jgi:DNA-binding beta-propeller fold protein YncE
VGNAFIVADGRVRAISSSAVVTTLAGSGSSSNSYADDTGSAARFNNPQGIDIDKNSNTLYVGDTNNYRIRKVTTSGLVITVAGSGMIGFADGIGTVAMFGLPTSVKVDPRGNLFVADSNNNRLVLISIIGAAVSTLASVNLLSSVFVDSSNITYQDHLQTRYSKLQQGSPNA